MDHELEEFRGWVAEQRTRTTPGGVRYPTEKRAWAAEYARRQMAAGTSFRGVLKELTVSEPALRSWLAKTSDPEKTTPRLRPVNVKRESTSEPAVAERETQTLTLVTPRGFRIEGLDAKSLVALVRELG